MSSVGQCRYLHSSLLKFLISLQDCSHLFSPQVISRIYKAAKNYHSWKAKNRPDFKPWLNPEQMMTTLPKFSASDIISNEKLRGSSESLEEGDMDEADFRDDDY